MHITITMAQINFVLVCRWRDDVDSNGGNVGGLQMQELMLLTPGVTS